MPGQLGEFWGESHQLLFMAARRVSEGALILALTLVLGQHLALSGAIFLARMLADESITLEDPNAAVGCNDVNIVIQNSEWNGITIGVQGDETERVDGAM